MKKTREFRKLARFGVRLSSVSFTLLYMAKEAQSDCFEMGFTASKKVGNAVQRNRCKRIMRSLALDVVRLGNVGSCKFVMIARDAMLLTKYRDIKAEALECVAKIERALKKREIDAASSTKPF